MSKIAFIFPGQGAQYIGMGKKFYENEEVSKEVYDLAGKTVGIDIAKLCFEENEQLDITEYTQIAMLTTELAMLKALESKGIHSDVNAGLSLGEYAALAASQVLSYEDVFKVVRKRGIFMQEAVPVGGAMSAILGLEAEKIEKICKQVSGIVSIANYNCPGQIVITGEENAVKEANEKLKEAGAKRTILLNVSGPFHSVMLKKAGEQLGEVLNDINILDFKIPYVSNVTAEYVTQKEEVKELLKKQVFSSVCWQQSVEKMIKEGVDTFIEIGPGKTLTGFLRKINRNVKVYNIDKYEDLDHVVELLKAE